MNETKKRPDSQPKTLTIRIEANENNIKHAYEHTLHKNAKQRKSILKTSQLQSHFIPKSTKIEYKPLYWKERKMILEAKDSKLSIQLAYHLIKRNRNKLLRYIKAEEIASTPENSYPIDSIAFKFYLDYFCNYLLLILFLVKNREIQNAVIALTHLFNDNDKVFQIEKFIDSIIKKSFDSAYVLKQATDITDYANYLSSLLQCSYQIGKNYIYDRCLLQYIDFIENIPDSQYFQHYLYFYLGELFIEGDNLSIAELCYDKANDVIRENDSLSKSINYQISALYNKALVCYIRNRVSVAVNALNEAKSLKLKQTYSNQKQYEEFDQTPDDQLIQIYLTLSEIDTDHIEVSFNYLHSLLKFEVNKSKSNDTFLSNEAKIKISSLLESIGLKKKCDFALYANAYGSGNVGQKVSNEDSFINFCVSKPKATAAKDSDMQEFEKFFLFMTKLSVLQVELMNKDQPDIQDLKKKAALPIYFSNNFKQSLSLELRLELNNIKFLSLKRKSILRNPNKEISIENFELRGLYNADSNAVISNGNMIEMRNMKMVKEKVNDYVRNKKLLNAKEMQMFNASTSNPQLKHEELKMMRHDLLSEFRHQQWISYDSLKKEIMDYIDNNLSFCKADEFVKDSVLIALMNKMTFEEINSIRSDPQCLIDVLFEYKEKNEQNINVKEVETVKDLHKLIEVKENNNVEESFSDHNDNHQLNNQSIDAMDIGKDD